MHRAILSLAFQRNSSLFLAQRISVCRLIWPINTCFSRYLAEAARRARMVLAGRGVETLQGLDSGAEGTELLSEYIGKGR